VNREFWRGRRVLITGHTGFKGSWLTLWLKLAGATITGFSLEPPTRPSLFEDAAVGEGIDSITGDVRDLAAVRAAVSAARPEVVIHMAAQSLVRPSYEDPVGTYATNVMGTVHLLESIREVDSVRVVVIVTSDKCYDNREWVWPYREEDPMGGRDPYSSSKGCAELLTAAYRSSFFSSPGAPRVVSVRAGNVVGGGDWAKDRLVPDLIRTFAAGEPALIRNPDATRPWQFVLDPLNGYLRVAEALFDNDDLPGAWNFGPPAEESRAVRWVADQMASLWGDSASWTLARGEHPHESFTLTLDSARARTVLGWKPLLDVASAIEWTAAWYRGWRRDPTSARAITREQIENFAAIDGTAPSPSS
jgi:CDP-glucose 4,6-dehydratase